MISISVKFAPDLMVSVGVCYGGKGQLHFVEEKAKVNASSELVRSWFEAEIWPIIQRWQLKFNPDNCKVMHIGHKFKTSYTRNPAIAEGPRDAGVPVEIW